MMSMLLLFSVCMCVAVWFHYAESQVIRRRIEYAKHVVCILLHARGQSMHIVRFTMRAGDSWNKYEDDNKVLAMF